MLTKNIQISRDQMRIETRQTKGLRVFKQTSRTNNVNGIISLHEI